MSEEEERLFYLEGAIEDLRSIGAIEIHNDDIYVTDFFWEMLRAEIPAFIAWCQAKNKIGELKRRLREDPQPVVRGLALTAVLSRIATRRAELGFPEPLTFRAPYTEVMGRIVTELVDAHEDRKKEIVETFWHFLGEK